MRVVGYARTCDDWDFWAISYGPISPKDGFTVDKLVLLSEAQEIIDQKDREIKSLSFKETPSFDLPAPRLQMRWVDHDEDTWICYYELVFPLEKDDVRSTEKNYTAESSDTSYTVSMGIPTRRAKNGMVPSSRYYDSPFRDGVHAIRDTKHLGDLPIYSISPDGKAFKRNDQEARCDIKATVTGVVNSDIASDVFTGALRWIDGSLQQEVKRTTYRNGILHAVETFWINVPGEQ